MRALVPVARVRTREITLGVLNADQKTVVRLNVETHEGLRGRVSAASAVRGYDKELERVDALLADTLSLPEATVPLVDEAVAAAGQAARGHERQAQPRARPRGSPRPAPRRSSSPACSR